MLGDPQKSKFRRTSENIYLGVETGFLKTLVSVKSENIYGRKTELNKYFGT